MCTCVCMGARQRLEPAKGWLIPGVKTEGLGTKEKEQ